MEAPTCACRAFAALTGGCIIFVIACVLVAAASGDFPALDARTTASNIFFGVALALAILAILAAANAARQGRVAAAQAPQAHQAPQAQQADEEATEAEPPKTERAFVAVEDPTGAVTSVVSVVR